MSNRQLAFRKFSTKIFILALIIIAVISAAQAMAGKLEICLKHPYYFLHEGQHVVLVMNPGT